MKTKKLNLPEQLKSSARIFGIAILCAAAITACSDDDDEEKITPVSLSQESVSVFINAQAEVTISDGKMPYTVSNNTNHAVATTVIDGTKLTVTGVAEGTADITVSGNDGSSAMLSVTVTSEPAALITIEQLKANLSSGESVTLPDAIKIKGAVISDGEGRNIDAKTAVLQEDNDKSGIIVQFTENHHLKVGDEVEVIVSKLMLAKVNGEVALKDVPEGSAVKTGSKAITPRETTVTDVIANKEAWTGTLVKLGAGCFTGGDGKYSGTLEYTDASGSVQSTVLEEADFADSDYPAQVNSLTGIVRVNGTDVRIDIRHTNDVVTEEGESLFVDNFESGILHPRFRGGNASNGGIVEIVDNPAQTGINTSSKVLRITNNFGSQQLNIDITKNNVDPALNVVNKGYDRFRFKYYTEVAEDRKVMWKHNGNGTQVDITIQPTSGGNVWSYAEIEMTEGEMNSLDMIHLRLNHKLDESNGNSTDVIYIDDLEFYNSTLTKSAQ